MQMERSTRGSKPIYQKENQPKLVNKRTDLLASLHNIKLPLHHTLSLKDNQFQSVPLTASLTSETAFEHIHSYRQHKFNKPIKQSSITEDYFKIYGQQIQHALKKDIVQGKFLNNHKIDGVLRARMLDWMVEVMSSYHFQNKTYFAGIQIMDRYFANSSQIIVPTQLHIIGVQSMFIATKMQQVYPLKMKTVFQKIAHKKISISQLTQMQNKIAQCLDFNLVSSTIFDIALAKIVRHLTQQDLYSDSLIKQIQDLCACVGKYIYYNYQLISSYDKQILAQSLANYVLEKYKLDKLNRPSSLQQQCREAIIQSIANFKRKYKGLSNLCKFTDKKILDLVQTIV